MKSLVTKEGGFFTAESATELSGAFSAILKSISEDAFTFSTPTYSVDEETLLSHSDEVYIPLFNANNHATWEGNLKKFKLKQETLADGTVTSNIVGKYGDKVLTAKGEFLDTAYDFWGTSASGKEVQAGGAASKLPAPDSRHLYTDIGSSTDLTANDNLLKDSNSLLTVGNFYQDNDNDTNHANSLESCDPDATNAASYTACVTLRSKLIAFARGKNTDGTARQHLGDMLNTKPVLVSYDSQKLIFAGTNEGYLHAFDTETGVEQWAFMPKSLLTNTAKFYVNAISTEHIYGLDGALNYWEYDKNQDGVISATDGDKRILYFGLRRGGKAYYALDITKADQPKLLWKIENTVGVDDGVWDELGETWSKPTLAKMRIQPSSDSSATELRNVMIFGAGYDAAMDDEDPSTRSADTVGSDVYIVDALTGSLIWSLQHSVYNDSALSNPIKHSVPGDIRILDMDRNGALDRLYFADTGGHVWRVDMDHDIRDDDASLYDYKDAKLTEFADLGSNGSQGSDNRKFFYEPDTALLNYNGSVRMTISLGSGYRVHPLNTKTHDRFYVLTEPNVYTEPSDTFTKLTNASLVNRNVLDSNDNLLSGGYNGWYYELPNTGEKVLASAVTVLNKIVFTTFAPVDETGSSGSGDPCEVPPNSARAYILDLFSGHAVADLDRNADTTSSDSSDGKDDSIVAGSNEILSAAQIIFRAPSASGGGSCTEGDCKQTVEIRVGKMNLPVMDDSNSNNASTGTGVDDVASQTDLTDILPRVFWIDHDVSP